MILAAKRIWLGTLGANIIILIGGVASGILAARFLAPEGRGLLAAILLWPHFLAGIVSLGLNEATTIRTAQIGGHYAMRSTVVWLSLCLAVIAGLVFYPLIPHLMGPERSAIHAFSQLYFLLFLPFTLLAMNLLAIDQGEMNFLRFNMLRILQVIVYPLLLAMLWCVGRVTVENAAYAAVAGTILAALIRLGVAGTSLLQQPDWSLAKSLLTNGARLHATNLVIMVVACIDQMFLVLWSDNKSLGLYVVSLTVATAGQGVLTRSFTDIILPKIASEPLEEIQKGRVLHYLRIAFGLIILGNIMLLLLSPWLIPFLFGEEFQVAVPIAMVLLVAFIFQGAKKTMVYMLRAKGQNRDGRLAEYITLVVFTAAVVPLYKLLGPIGVAWTLLMAHGVGTAFLAIMLPRHFGLRVEAWFSSNIISSVSRSRNNECHQEESE